jgi:transcriptional regulator with XRE-family HTH domain
MPDRSAASSLGEIIRQQRELAELSMRQFAELAGISNPYLSQIERGLRKPSAEILQQIAKGLRISAEALYVRAGFLEERDPEGTVPQSILADAVITERQKHVLLEIYDSFCRENAARRQLQEEDEAGEQEPESAGTGHAGQVAPADQDALDEEPGRRPDAPASGEDPGAGSSPQRPASAPSSNGTSPGTHTAV